MKSFREHLQTDNHLHFCQQVEYACDELGIDFFEFVDYFLEDQIAQETDPERLDILNRLYSEGMFGNMLQGMAQGAGNAWQNLKQGWQAGVNGAMGQMPGQQQGQNPQQQAIQQAWQILNQAGLGEPFQQAFEPILQQIVGGQQGGAQQQPQQGGSSMIDQLSAWQQQQKAQDNSMMGRLSKWQQQQKAQQAQQQPQQQTQTAWYTPEGEPLEENDMKTFHQYLESQRLNTLRDNICAGMIHLGVEDYEGFMVEWLAQEYGVEVARDLTEAGEPFAGKKNWWQNMMGGLKGAGQAALGTGMAGVGGGMGGAIGGGVGAAKGAFGYSGDPSDQFTVQGGARDGSQTGRSWMGQGWDKIKGAWAGRHDAGIVSAYQNAQSAVDKFAQAVQGHPTLASDTKLVDAMQKMSKYLLSKGKQVDKILSKGAAGAGAGGAADPAVSGAA